MSALALVAGIATMVTFVVVIAVVVILAVETIPPRAESHVDAWERRELERGER